MPTDEREESESRRLALKRQYFKRALAEGRGPEALAALSRLYARRQETWASSDDDIRNNFREIAIGNGAIDLSDEFSRQQLDSLLRSKEITDPEIRKRMETDLAAQKSAVNALRELGIPEDMLPHVSPAVAYINAIHGMTGQPLLRADGNKFQQIEKLLSGKPPTNTLN